MYQAAPLRSRLKCLALQIQRLGLCFLPDALKDLRGYPLLGSLRMISLGFLPGRQVTYSLGQWPSRRQVRQFLTDAQRERMFCASPTRLRNRPLLDDKVRFAELISGFVPTPKLLAVIQQGRLFPVAPEIPTPDARGLIAATRTCGTLVLKPRDGDKGRGIFFLQDTDDGPRLNRDLVSPETLAARLRFRNYIVTTRVRQAEYAARIYEETTNSIRMLTMVDPASGKAFMPLAVQRLGSRDSFPVDNYGYGGLYSFVDIESGRLSAATFRDGSRRATHPDSGAQIEGVSVPRWQETVDSVLRLAQRLDFIDLIGWDVVLTDDGFAVIEGNGNPQPHQRSWRPLLADERVRAFYSYHLSWWRRRAGPRK